LGITGTDLQIQKAVLPSPNTHFSIREYYGLKSKVVKFLILKEFMIPDSLIKAGWVFPTLSAPLVDMKSSTPGLILKTDFPYN
jgi:hypothetical protein